MKILWLLFISFLSLLSCKSQRYTIDALPDTQLIFGDGGGFTGAVTEYILLENGQIFKKSSLQEAVTDLGTIAKSEAKQLLQEAKNIQAANKPVNQPGNLYYFINLKQGGKEQKMTWGEADSGVNPTLQTFYKKLLSKTQTAAKPTM